MKILVTGGAGFIGSHITEQMQAAGHRVVVVDDLSTGDPKNLSSSVTLHKLDIRSTAVVELIEKEKFDVICHHAAQIDLRRSVEEPSVDAEINVVGTVNLLNAAKRAQVKQFIHASSVAVYGVQSEFPATEATPTQPVTPYGAGKLAGEHYAYAYHAQTGLAVTCFRYANVYGPRQSSRGEAGVVAVFLRQLIDGSVPTIFGDGSQTRDFIYVGDIAAANVAALGRTGFHVYNVGTGRETTVIELHKMLATLTQSTKPPRFAPSRAGDSPRSVISGQKVQRELKVRLETPLVKGLERTAQWFRDPT